MDLQLAGRNWLVKAKPGGGNRTGSKFEECRDLGIYGHVEGLSGTGTAADRPLVLGSPAKAGNRLDRAKELDERSEVVWSHVKQGPSTFLEKKLWIGMPGVGARISKGRSGRDRSADSARLDHPACRLQPGAEECVGRISELDFVLGRGRHDRLRLLDR